MLVEIDMEEGLTEEIEVIWERGYFIQWCWVYVIFFACVCGGEVHMLVLRLTIPVDNFFVDIFGYFEEFLKICNLILVNGLESMF